MVDANTWIDPMEGAASPTESARQPRASKGGGRALATGLSQGAKRRISLPQFIGRISAAWLLATALTACVSTEMRKTPSVQADVPRHAAAASLTVGLYPDVPRVQQFQDAISSAWAQVQPEVALNFLTSATWDGGYDMDPPASADVFVLDGMFLEYFQSQSYLELLAPSEVANLADFVPYAINGLLYNGSYYGIPQLGCSNILFYQDTDTPLVNATTLSAVENALGTCTYTSEIPPDRRGLIIDLSGGTTSAAMYLDAVHSLTGQTPALPWSVSQINPQAIANVRSLLGMASYENGTTSLSQDYERGSWYSSGWGRGLIGFTEAMSAMAVGSRTTLDFKVMPLSDTSTAPYFYADVIGVNTTTVSRGTRSLALQLANVMAAEATMVAAMKGTPQEPSPQFLMPTRPSIFAALEQVDPIYGKMYQLVTAADPVMFKVDSNSRQWLKAMKNTIKEQIRTGYSCPCDSPALQFIADDTAAQNICPATCADHGGWDGQWTNQYPAAQGMSVCGCNACPVP